jgi:mannosyltransferase OCH1-like enzyme
LGVSAGFNITGLEKFVSRNEYNNAIMISTPRNPMLKRYIEYTLEQCKKNKNLQWDFAAVQNTTGPFSLNTFFENNKIDDSVLMKFEPEIFEPCDMNHVCNITKNTIAIHQYESSWLSPWMKVVAKLYFYLRLQWISIFFLLLMIILLYRCKKKCRI